VTDTQRPAQPPDIGRRTLTPFGYAVCVVVPILVAAIGLTILHFNYDKEDLVAGSRIPVLTSDWQPGDDASDVLVQGELSRDDAGCLVLTTSEGQQVTPVWPADYEATVQRVGPSDQIKVYDTDRDIVARSDQQLQMGGGYTDVGEYAGRPCAPTSGEVFVVQSEIEVVGSS